ncbi:MAG: prepilin-type N-terminal cleavage/methylation domain-containing protein [Verrucomicrobia bacterium]|nr:prepilin-type N-terminal cleavage/methylation domain-containing protein [Verrucomicrobiota bacterium]
MTSPTGKPVARAASQGLRRAFTLVELMLVMTLLTVVISVAAPSLAAFFRGRTLESEARRLLALTRHGQSRAASEGLPMVLWIDVDTGTYGLAERFPIDGYDPKAVQFQADRDVRIEVIAPANDPALAASTRASGTLTAQTTARTTSPLLATQPNESDIYFLPDGSIGEASLPAIRLLDRDDRELWLSLAQHRLYYEIGNQTNDWIATYR